MVNDDNSREYVCNISSCDDEVLFLVNKLNEYNIELHHARNIIEDFEFENM